FPSRLAGFRGHAINNWDLSIIKRVLITEQVKLQFRGEAFNLFNHPFFRNPNTDPTSASFSKITDTSNAPRYLQLGLNLTFYNVPLKSRSVYARISESAHSISRKPRQHASNHGPGFQCAGLWGQSAMAKQWTQNRSSPRLTPRIEPAADRAPSRRNLS